MKMKRMKPFEMLPTLLTLGNLFSGFLAIAYLTDSLHIDPSWAAERAHGWRIEKYTNAMICVFLAMIFDAVDGKVARMFGSASEFGSQIDSLSDVVSFGAAPALLFKVMVEAHPWVIHPRGALILAVVYLACAALRLARFNVETAPDEEAHQRFKGLPSPAAAGMVLALAFINIQLDKATAHSWVLNLMPWLVPIIGFLMVSRIPYIHLTHALFQDRRPFRFLVLLIFVGALAIWVPEYALPIVVILYVISGPVTWLRHRAVRRAQPVGLPIDDDDEDII
jgi:CDP-diacylglycerol--serine O-phosphatidyltransferase